MLMFIDHAVLPLAAVLTLLAARLQLQRDARRNP